MRPLARKCCTKTFRSQPDLSGLHLLRRMLEHPVVTVQALAFSDWKWQGCPQNCYQQVMKAIFRIKAGDFLLRDEMRVIGKRLSQQGAEALIVGCTKLSLMLSQRDFDCLVYDVLDVLTQAALREVLGGSSGINEVALSGQRVL